jgi:hypothetical protein
MATVDEHVEFTKLRQQRHQRIHDLGNPADGHRNCVLPSTVAETLFERRIDGFRDRVEASLPADLIPV